ncbi:glycosyltransferase [Luteococcus sp. H138]|uniref:glycosyltransferase n=1 Tax=unclassified Luteococcus TaxID=2639923 RepID=UPI00313C8D75
MPQRYPDESAIAVRCVPANHPYVATAIGPQGHTHDGLLVLDEIPDADGFWWPPALFDPARRDAALAGADVVHVHFGVEQVPLWEFRATVDELNRRGIALVVTVHDLRNPHLEDDAPHAERLDLLLREADAVVTLTRSAAAEIRRRWGRAAVVLPHPHVAPLARIGGAAGPRGKRRGQGRRPLVGVDLKGLRTNMMHAAQLAQVAAAVTGCDCDLRVGIHAEVLDGLEARDPELARLLRHWQDGESDGAGITVAPHERYSDDGLLDHLASLSAVVLPYRFGTHSGYLEACRDVGTAVVAPAVGCYHDQHDCPTFGLDDIEGTLPGALRAALDRRVEWTATREERRTEAEGVRAAHRRIYRQVASSRRDGPVGQ